jgi:hypothetical protein
MIFNPNSACLKQAGELQTVLALSKVRLFKSSLLPSVSTIKADLTAEEADYDDYPAGGETITAFLDPLLDPAGGASITAPTTQFDVTTDPPIVTNLIGGFWLEDAAGAVRVIGTFAAPIPMEVAGQGFPLNIKIVQATGQIL